MNKNGWRARKSGTIAGVKLYDTKNIPAKYYIKWSFITQFKIIFENSL